MRQSFLLHIFSLAHVAIQCKSKALHSFGNYSLQDVSLRSLVKGRTDLVIVQKKKKKKKFLQKTTGHLCVLLAGTKIKLCAK